MRKRILVVERSRTIQVLLSTTFRNAGHHVIACHTAEEALALLANLNEVPDLIFLALDFEKQAYKVIQYAKAQRAYDHTRLVALVLEEEKADIQRTFPEAHVSCLVKPFHIQDALSLVSAPISGAGASSRTGREREGRK